MPSLSYFRCQRAARNSYDRPEASTMWTVGMSYSCQSNETRLDTWTVSSNDEPSGVSGIDMFLLLPLSSSKWGIWKLQMIFSLRLPGALVSGQVFRVICVANSDAWQLPLYVPAGSTSTVTPSPRSDLPLILYFPAIRSLATTSRVLPKLSMADILSSVACRCSSNPGSLQI